MLVESEAGLQPMQTTADFSMAYADQNERDHAALIAAVRAGFVKPQMVE